MADQLTAYADVPTAVAARYAKQLASHLGREAKVRSEPEGQHVVLDVGNRLLMPGASSLQLRATAHTPEGLDPVEHVIGRTSSASASATDSS